ncbi:MAG TPA: pyridoxamine 5'-phosphate oxidase [Acidimicrobiales bacterium]|jgi:pyridoxamine 5'-phosphate oxidase|nr:pyridoxamine 5'-phosphate oxidase [Acidimicrobiales bacterium]
MDLEDLDPNPIVELQRWLDDAVAEGLPHPTAMSLATAGADGRPSARHVLLKGLDERGIEWHTNYESRKGRDLAENPYASVVLPWFGMWRQVVAAGPVAKVSAEDSDAYFRSRDRGSQLGAWASPQSQPIPDRAWLEARVAEFDTRFPGQDVPRPAHWGGFRLRPDWIDFWHSQPDRLHDRFRYERASEGVWTINRLAP